MDRIFDQLRARAPHCCRAMLRAPAAIATRLRADLRGCTKRALCATAQGHARLRVLQSETHDPWLNLATEEFIFADMDPSFQTLFLWRNSPTVVIGRHQNAWSECKVDEMEAAGIKLARRHSGGGAVFQDLGNTNFTFLSPANDFDKARNTGIIVRALAELGVSAQPSGRNDITVGARKVSGAAFKQSGDRSFHHGTLLINVDMGALQRYLNPHKAKLQSKGVKSVAARVVNLADINPSITHDSAVHAITQSFFREYGGECPVETLGTAFVEAEPKLQRYYEQVQQHASATSLYACAYARACCLTFGRSSRSGSGDLGARRTSPTTSPPGLTGGSWTCTTTSWTAISRLSSSSVTH